MKLKIKPHKNIDKHNKMIHKQRHSVNPFGCQLREKDEDKPIQLDHGIVSLFYVFLTVNTFDSS